MADVGCDWPYRSLCGTVPSATQRRQWLSVGHEQQRETVVAPAFTAGLRTILEDVSLMAPAARAVVFGARQHELEVALRAHVSFDRLREARPTGAAFELVIAREEREKARSADERAFAFFVVERARAGAFRILAEQHGIARGLEYRLPLVLRLLQLHDVGSDREILFVQRAARNPLTP